MKVEWFPYVTEPLPSAIKLIIRASSVIIPGGAILAIALTFALADVAAALTARPFTIVFIAGFAALWTWPMLLTIFALWA